MKKKEFLNELKERLSGLPYDELMSRLSFYEESINDRMDEGKSEEEAIKELGTIDEIVNQVASETSLVTLVKARKTRKLTGLEILFLVLGFPLWFPLFMVLLVLCLVVCLLFWIIGFVPLIAAVGSIGFGAYSFISFFMSIGAGSTNVAMIGFALAGIGLGLVLIPAVHYSFIGTMKLNKLIFIGIKKLFIRRRK